MEIKNNTENPKEDEKRLIKAGINFEKRTQSENENPNIKNPNIKNSPFLYLLQIATQKKKKNNINPITGISALPSSESEIKKDEFSLQDIDTFMKDIVEKNDSTFLSGDTNLFEFLISKYLNIEKNCVENVKEFEFKIDLQLDDYNLLNEFGLRMPNLISLNLSNSFLKNISNIGISFKNLKILNVTNCQIEELEGKRI